MFLFAAFSDFRTDTAAATPNGMHCLDSLSHAPKKKRYNKHICCIISKCTVKTLTIACRKRWIPHNF
jgi:hypothetical protein